MVAQDRGSVDRREEAITRRRVLNDATHSWPASPLEHHAPQLLTSPPTHLCKLAFPERTDRCYYSRVDCCSPSRYRFLAPCRDRAARSETRSSRPGLSGHPRKRSW